MKNKIFHLKKKASQLSNNEINKILKFKNKVWKFGIKSQIQWYKNNVYKDDINIIGLLKENKKICSYTLLRKRSFFLKNKKKPYFYLDTFISDNLNINAFSLMKFNKKCIGKKICFLICEKKFEKLYTFFGFKKILKKNFEIMDHQIKKKLLMGYNIKRFNSKLRIYLNK